VNDRATPHPVRRAWALAIVLALAVPVSAADEEAPAAGKFLVASRDLRDPNFARTVVLLTRYDLDGAVGLVINRTTSLGLAETLPEVEGLGAGDGSVWAGGPVMREKMTMLLRTGTPPDESEPVVADVHVSRSRDLLERLASARPRGTVFRVYAGYSGWAPLQLDAELARGSWHVVDADPDLVFASDPDGIWERLVPPAPALRAAR
jgi:putative transcriptional regulator